MEGESSTDPLTPLDAFVERFLADQDAGTVRTLREYLDLFPGDDDAIAREYLALKDGLTAPVAKSPDQVGPYRLIRELGRGGQAVVYLAEDTRFRNRQVALKVLTETVSLEALERFKREAEVTSRLKHPGIAVLHDAGIDEARPYIAMQYVEGQTLAQRIRSSKDAEDSTSVIDLDDLPSAVTEAQDPSPTPSGPQTRDEITKAVALIEKAARALHAAHEAGIIHRDIKPGNIMVGAGGQPVILDFGLARELEGQLETLTQTGQLFGTPAYMSPEQIAAHRIRLDARTDVYSLGVALFECVTLRRPFESPTREGLYKAIMGKDPPDPRSLNPMVSSDLRVIIETALEKDLDRRYQTARGLAEDLRRLREHKPIQAKPASLWVRVMRWARRRPGAAAAVGTLMVGFTVSLLLFLQRDAALRRYEQMSDVAKVDALLAREKELWPRREHLVPAMAEWLKEARKVFQRIGSHQRELAELERRAHPYTHIEQQADERKRRRDHAELFEALRNYEKQLPGIELKMKDAVDHERRTDLEWQRDVLLDAIEDLRRDDRLTQRLTWRFDDPADAWRRQVLHGLLERMPTLESMIKDVAERHSFAKVISERTVAGGAAANLWATCIADVARSEKYSTSDRPLQVTPQVGLKPLGKDSHSKLWEFWHVGSGEEPTWQSDTRMGSSFGSVEVSVKSGIVMVLVPGGEFWMGNQQEDPKKRNFDPGGPAFGPVDRVTLDPYFISKYELTQRQWSLVMPERSWPSANQVGQKPTGARLITELNPVENVSWHECTEAARRWGLALPTEAQWENATRAGSGTRWWCGDTIKSLQGNANLADAYLHRYIPTWDYQKALNDGHVVHAPVGSFAPNHFGLHDVVGNVREWCRDRANGYRFPVNPGDGLRTSDRRFALARLYDKHVHWAANHRIVRGGGSGTIPRLARSAYRQWTLPIVRGGDLGCRFVRAIDP